MTKPNSRKLLLPLTALIATAAGGAVAIAGLTAAAADDPPTVESWQQLINTDTQAAAAVSLPEELVATDAPLNFEDASYRGSSAHADYWTSFHDDGRLCLLMVLKQPEYSVSASCATQDEFALRGIAQQAVTPHLSVRSYLVPDQVIAAASAHGTEVTSNVIERDPHVTDEKTITLDVSASRDGRLFEILPFDSSADVLAESDAEESDNAE